VRAVGDRPIRQRLRADLLVARKAGDTESVDQLRILLAAIGNAEAVELDVSHPKEVEGWADVPRRHLTPDDLAGILRREAEDLRAAAAEYEQNGRPDEAARLRARARLVDGYRADPS
jgi:uncharacterized protein YqeY